MWVRYVVNSMWRVFNSCFLSGAWSCLSKDMNLKARHSFFCASVDVLNGVQSNQRRSYDNHGNSIGGNNWRNGN